MIRLVIGSTPYPEEWFNWQEETKTVGRSETYHGCIITKTVLIEVIGKAYQAVKAADDAEDLAGELDVKTQIWDSINGWQDDFVGLVDFETIEYSTGVTMVENNTSATPVNKITFSAYSSNFANKLIERQSSKVLYDKLEGIDGNTITPFAEEYKTVNIDGINVVGDNVPTVFDEKKYEQNGGTPRNVILGLITQANNTAFKLVAQRQYGGSELPGGIQITDCYYLARTNTNLKIDYSIKYDFGSDLGTQPNDWRFYLRVYKAKFDELLALDSIVLLSEKSHFDEALNQTFSGSLDIDLLENEGIVFYCYHWAQNFLTTQGSYFEVKEDSDINTTYVELAPSTPCEFVPPFEMGTRILESITGQANALKSNFFGRTDSPTVYSEDGEGSLFFHTNGRLIRQFPVGYITTDSDKKSQLTETLEEWFKNLDKKFCLGAGVIYENGQYKFQVEDRKEFYKSEVSYTFDLDSIEIDTYSREKDMSLYTNKTTVGSLYEPPEEIGGLEEYNSPQTYNNPVLNDNEYDLKCTDVSAAYIFEFTKRRPYTDQETEDYRYDKNNFLFNVERHEGGFRQLSQTDFEEIIGLDNIEFFINLNITPKRCLLRHGWYMNSGFKGYQGDKLTYAGSDIVTDLSTRKTGEANNVVETDDVPISILESPKLTGKKIEFIARINPSAFDSIVNNPYALIGYPDLINGGTGYGYIPRGQELSSNLLDKTTNVILWETVGFSTEGSFRLLQNGSFRLLEDGGKRLLE
jgi:hypothetical protein